MIKTNQSNKSINKLVDQDDQAKKKKKMTNKFIHKEIKKTTVCIYSSYQIHYNNLKPKPIF